MSRKISQMTEATTIKSGDISVVVQDGETKQFPLDLLATKAQADEYKVGVETQLADYEQEITDIKNQYDKELYTPTITVTNTSTVKTGQGDTLDYSASVEDGVVKSAILSGQTLVNVLDCKALTKSNEGAKYTYDGKYFTNPNITDHSPWSSMKSVSNLIKPNTNYFVMLYNPSSVEVRMQMTFLNSADATKDSFNIPLGERASYKVVSPSNANGLYLKFFPVNTTTPNTKLQIMILEYQEGMENWDIPYFEGMQSVKMPVLTTTGKNLFDGKLTTASIDVTNGSVLPNDNSPWSATNYINVKNIDSLYFQTTQLSNMNVVYMCFDANKKFIGYKAFYNSLTGVIKPLENTHYIRLRVPSDINVSTTQIEKGAVATSYEPYKSNILTTPADLELRGIGDVKDELNCLTGEVTERIGEIVLDGTQNFSVGTSPHGNPYFIYAFNGSKGNGISLSDKFQTYTDAKFFSSEYRNGLCLRANGTGFNISFADDTIKTNSQAKAYLQQNPVTVQYQLATEVIKTVVLNPSGTLASETPYMWKNGSIQLSSDGLVPNLDYAVTTSRVGVIETNMSETITNEKRIHALEVILAQSTIAAAADAVSLQSDLESTTMSTDGAQLETENTQDNFLYEMILLLIENNAHDESLFDKVCMFYLYGKLSDEQFTNIYNLLYPVNPEEE